MGMNPSSEHEIMGYQDGQAALHNTIAPPTLWRNVTFRRVLYGYGISVFGDCFNGIAISLWVLQTTGSAKSMAAVQICNMAVSFYLDRWQVRSQIDWIAGS